jgi:L-lactate dehydrogenase
MKIGIVGTGAVGAATAMAVSLQGRARELVLVNRNRARAKGIAADIRYGLALVRPVAVADGDYAALAGAAAVIVTVGINEKTGGATDRSDPAGRLRLLGSNAAIYQDVVPQIVAAAPEAVLIVATDPPEPLADVARRLAPDTHIMSTGTYLDSLRFRFHIAQRLAVDPASVAAHVIGEHGTSSVFLWSSANVAGVPVRDLAAARGVPYDDLRNGVERDVRFANISIIEGTGASQYGIGIVSARIADAVVSDERAVFPVGSYVPRYGLTVSLPCIVGRDGVSEALMPAMSSEEVRALDHSVDVLRNAGANANP